MSQALEHGDQTAFSPVNIEAYINVEQFTNCPHNETFTARPTFLSLDFKFVTNFTKPSKEANTVKLSLYVLLDPHFHKE